MIERISENVMIIIESVREYATLNTAGVDEQGEALNKTISCMRRVAADTYNIGYANGFAKSD